MKNIFDYKRFGKYFVYDLKNAWYNGGINLILFACMPAFFVLLVQIVNLVTTGGFSTSLTLKSVPTAGFICALVALAIAMPIRLYGNITEKRYGSNWLMIPASTFEKWLSMVIIICVVLPVVMLAGLFAVDSLMSLVFGSYYHGECGNMLVVTLHQFAASDAFRIAHVNAPVATYFELVEGILVFALGAVCFKKAKVAKTILANMAVGFVLSMAIVPVFRLIDGDSLFTFFENLEGMDDVQIAKWVTAIASAIEAIIICALAGGLYARLRTIKH